MRELIVVFGNTRSVVLVALISAIYAAVLIPFKVVIPIIPGFTEFRPANVIPIVCSLLFGPCAAWGSAFGNLIGDLFGTLGPGSIFGFIGNFLYGYLPYKIWGKIRFISSGGEPDMTSPRQICEYIVIVLLSSLCCATVIGWGVDLLGLLPFAALANIIFLNNFIVSLILGPPILIALYKRVKKLGLLYTQIIKKEELPQPKFQLVGIIFIFIGSIFGFVAGNFISAGIYNVDFLGHGFGGTKGEIGLGLGVLPFIILILVSLIFL